MHDLLGALGERHWRAWIAQDIEDWESRKLVSHHLSAYGGMGSFNDIGFEDIWLGTLFDNLQSVCYYFAHRPTARPDIPDLERSMGTIGFELTGWRCLACGYGVVSRRDVEYFVARRVIRQRILSAVEQMQLQDFVHAVIETHPADTVFTKERVEAWACASSIHIREGNEWLRPCPSCASNDNSQNPRHNDKTDKI
jgi:hypothetical protein